MVTYFKYTQDKADYVSCNEHLPHIRLQISCCQAVRPSQQIFQVTASESKVPLPTSKQMMYSCLALIHE